MFSKDAGKKYLGIDVVETQDINEVVDALQQGALVGCSQSGPSIFVDDGGHYIVLSSIDENNNISVKDPNKYSAVTLGFNDRLFTPEEINRGASRYYIFKWF